MWLVTKYGFFSVVAHNRDPEVMLVRGRNVDDLAVLRGFAQGRGIELPEVVTTGGSDYCCRMFVPRRDWERLGMALTAEIAYPNFKAEVHGQRERDDAYMQMWATMRRYQEEVEARKQFYCPEHRYNPAPNSGFAFCPWCELGSGRDDGGGQQALFDFADEEELDDEGDLDDPTEDDIFEYLDALRDSGVTNMFGARPYLQEQFGFTTNEAGDWLGKWMRTYGSRHGLEEGE